MHVLRNIGYTLIGLLALVTVVMTASRFWPPTALQKQARAALEATPERPGSNAWGDLETLLHEDIDAAQRQALVDAQKEALEAWAVQWVAALKEEETLEAADFPKAPEIGGQATAWQLGVPACDPARPCLAHVRAHQQALAAAFGERPALLERIDTLSRHGHVASPYPPVALAMNRLPPAGVLHASSLRYALLHLEGQSMPALEGLCRDMGAARMLAAESDSLLLSQVGLHWLQSNTLLVGEVLAELPGDAVLPGNCAAAMAPLPVHALGQCNAFAGEYRSSTAMIDASAAQMTDRPGGGLFFNPEKTRYRHASVMGQSCLPTAREQLAADQRWMQDNRPVSWWRLECAANAVGCILTAIAGPAYDGFINRAQDADAGLRLLRAAVSLRSQGGDGIPLAGRLADLPPEQAASPRAIRASADGRALEVERYDRRRGDGPIRLSLEAAPVTGDGMASR